jgi:hypothetical protein
MRRLAIAAAAILLVVAIWAAYGAISPGTKSPRRRPSVAVAGEAPCGSSTGKPVDYRHVVWIIFENKAYDRVIGSDEAPYMNALAEGCGVAANFFAETHPSAPNYIAMTSGGMQGLTTDDDPIAFPIDAPNIFSQLGTRGWRGLIESMPTNCRLSYVLPEYYARHNAPAYYTNVRSACAEFDVPLRGELDISARFTYIAPSSCHAMHTCEVAAGDAWLQQFMPKILSSREYRSKRTVVFVTWDEADRGAENHIPTLVIAPSVRPGTVVADRYDHYSMLRTTQELLGLRPFLGKAATARSMRSAFGI